MDETLGSTRKATIMEEIDKTCFEIIDDNINMCIPWYFMETYARYEQHDPLISNDRYQRVIKLMLDNWDSIEHESKSLVDKDHVWAERFEGVYPKRVKLAVEQIRKVHSRGK
tara:strand:+ start:141 stop:476 length:336 start_codon:yes stop_codon:yes gene_type:complete